MGSVRQRYANGLLSETSFVRAGSQICRVPFREVFRRKMLHNCISRLLDNDQAQDMKKLKAFK